MLESDGNPPECRLKASLFFQSRAALPGNPSGFPGETALSGRKSARVWYSAGFQTDSSPSRWKKQERGEWNFVNQWLRPLRRKEFRVDSSELVPVDHFRRDIQLPGVVHQAVDVERMAEA